MATVKKSRFAEMQSTCLSAGLHYEDPEFPAVPKSVYFSKVDSSIQWRRPGELSLLRQPKFVIDGASRFDLDQGELGDCWFIAAAATLACHSELFKVVVPDDQSYDRNYYAGIFHFNFWCEGQWREVIIDDRLPTRNTDKGWQLIFCNNREDPREMWSALLEKAYAKLFGSYEALDGGMIDDALVDLTGGCGRSIDLTKDLPSGLFQRLLNYRKMSTLMGCGTSASEVNQLLSNGLVTGHAYSIIEVLILEVRDATLQLLRLRNPWGKSEWNGAWSDGSALWSSVDKKTRQELLVEKDDGEFWMCFKDWMNNFQTLQLCYLPPDNSLQGCRKWSEVSFNGSWVRSLNSGESGSGEYWSNSQYCISLKAPERQQEAVDSKCTMIVSLMQKSSRRNRTLRHVQSADVTMSFDVYRRLTSADYDKHALQLVKEGSVKYQCYHEIVDHFRVDPGVYVIIPLMYDSHVPTEYLLRVYTDCVSDGRNIYKHKNRPTILASLYTDLFSDIVHDRRENGECLFKDMLTSDNSNLIYCTTK